MDNVNVELADRYEQLQAAAKTKALEIAKLLEAGRAAQKAHAEKVKAARTELSRLQVDVARAGEAKNALERAVPRDTREALDRAESAVRAVEVRLKDARLSLKLATEERDRLKKAGADGQVLKNALRSIETVEARVAEVEAEAERTHARAEEARRSYAVALEKVKREARGAERAGVHAR